MEKMVYVAGGRCSVEREMQAKAHLEYQIHSHFAEFDCLTRFDFFRSIIKPKRAMGFTIGREEFEKVKMGAMMGARYLSLSNCKRWPNNWIHIWEFHRPKVWTRPGLFLI
jgi:hypothetical protein